jgi:hypothetical protein
MTERLTNTTVTFARPFSLRGVQGTFPPGVYSVTVTEEQLDGLTVIAYRRVRTTIELPSGPSAPHSRQLIEIAPGDLEAALASDGEGG